MNNNIFKPANILITLILSALIIILILIFRGSKSNNEHKTTPTKEPTVQAENINKNKLEKDVVIIDFNEPVSLSYKTKKEIYDIRKKAVEKSIFATDNYEPKYEVLGGIVDRKPWISINACSVDGKAKVSGASRLSMALINPSVPVFIDFPMIFQVSNLKNPSCNFNSNIIPSNIIYRKQQKEIEVIYQNIPFLDFPGFLYQFNGINARDLGYKYVYIDNSKTTDKIKYTQNSNASNKIVEFRDFIHLGYSCQVDGGCNNLSPIQPELDFAILPHDGKTEIYLKLWKERPESADNEADLYEKITVLSII